MPSLTKKFLDSIKPTAQRQEIADALVRGLYFLVQPSGHKSWAFRYRMHGRSRKLSIGPYPAISLAEARKLAAQAAVQIASYTDPGTAKRDARKAAEAERSRSRDLVPQIVAQYLERHVKRNTRPSTSREYERLMTRDVLPVWHNKWIGEITKRDVVELLDVIVDRGSPVTANRVLAVLQSFFNWCVGRGILENSPAAHVQSPTEEKTRSRVLTDLELRRVWDAAAKEGGTYGTLVQLLILTGQRRGEVAGIGLSELDITHSVWTLPQHRTKNHRHHEVPLSRQACEIIRSLAPQTPFLLTTDGRSQFSGFAKAKRRLDHSIGIFEAAEANGKPYERMPPWTLHDIRRTVASGMAFLEVSLPVIEKVLNHVSGSFGGIVAVYQHHNYAREKREALQKWADHVDRLVRRDDLGRPKQNAA